VEWDENILGKANQRGERAALTIDELVPRLETRITLGNPL
jgi:hypothetical protein